MEMKGLGVNVGHEVLGEQGQVEASGTDPCSV